MWGRSAFSLCVVALLAGCASVPNQSSPPRFARASFTDLPGWTADNGNGMANAMGKSCARMAKAPASKTIKPSGTVGDWQPFCAALQSSTSVRSAVETHLVAWRVTTSGSSDGLFTGYYESGLRGSRTKHGPYQTPLRARPLDHVVVDLGAFKPDLKGQRITGQLRGDAGSYTLAPYPTREGIETGKIPSSADRVIVWVDDPVDAFFLEIQGSGRVALDDGTVMHVGYADRNGQAYTAIGKILVERGELTKETASMQSIRAWIKAHPQDARALMHANASYIFFREIGADGPLGAENVALTPLRSMAVDPAFWSYGTPMYIDTAAPDGNTSKGRIQRLMVAQDTGGAIKGAIRGDVFWGFGDTAETNAGIMKSRGNLWVLLPKGITPQ